MRKKKRLENLVFLTAVVELITAIITLLILIFKGE